MKIISHNFPDLVHNACVQGSTNGTNGVPISFKVLPMVPMVMPIVPLALPMVPLVNQWYYWLRVPAFTYILNKIYVRFEINFSICTRRFLILTQKCIFSKMLEVKR